MSSALLVFVCLFGVGILLLHMHLQIAGLSCIYCLLPNVSSAGQTTELIPKCQIRISNEVLHIDTSLQTS